MEQPGVSQMHHAGARLRSCLVLLAIPLSSPSGLTSCSWRHCGGQTFACLRLKTIAETADVEQAALVDKNNRHWGGLSVSRTLEHKSLSMLFLFSEACPCCCCFQRQDVGGLGFPSFPLQRLDYCGMGLPRVHPEVTNAMRCYRIDERHLLRFRVVLTLGWRSKARTYVKEMYMVTQGLYGINSFRKLEDEFRNSFCLHPKDQVEFHLRNRICRRWPLKRAQQDDDIRVHVVPYRWRRGAQQGDNVPARQEVFLIFW